MDNGRRLLSQLRQTWFSDRYPLPARRVLAVALGVLLVAGLFVALPFATITVSVPAEPISTQATFAAAIGDESLQEHRTVLTSGSVPARKANGMARFGYSDCFFFCFSPPPPVVTVPAGTRIYTCATIQTTGEVKHCTQRGVAFRTLEPAKIHKGRNAECFLFGCSYSSDPVRIEAIQGGPAGNVVPGKITEIDTKVIDGIGIFVSAGDTAGGMEARPHVVAEQDVEAGAAALEQQLRGPLQQKIEESARSRGLTVVHIEYDREVTSNPQVGEDGKAVEVSLTLSARMIGYDEGDLRGAVVAALRGSVPSGRFLVESQVRWDAPSVSEETKKTLIFIPDSDRPEIHLVAHGLTTTLDAGQLPRKYRGRSLKGTVSDLRKQFGAKVSVDRGPLPLPWLPLRTKRIEIRVQYVPPEAPATPVDALPREVLPPDTGDNFR